MDDGVLVFFGYPQAHEDDAAWAIHAGQRVIRELPEIRIHAKLNLRIGVATGLVFVGGLRGVQVIVGGTTMGEHPIWRRAFSPWLNPAHLFWRPQRASWLATISNTSSAAPFFA